MPLSPYLFDFPCGDGSGRTAVFAARKGSLCLVPAPVFEALRRGEPPGAPAPALERLGVLVADPEAERARVLGYLEELNRVSPLVMLAVILGMDCNFACPYCYEGDRKGPEAMAPGTAQALAEFARARLGPGKTRLRALFYGGETLLYRDRLRQAAGLLRSAAGERGAGWAFGVVTNGSLLTPEAVDELLPLGLASVQVTLDGPPHTHDASRPYRDGRGSFARIVANLAAVRGRVRLGLGGNYTRNNWRAFPGLFDHLEAAGLGPADFAQVRFDAAIPMAGGDAAPETLAGCAAWTEPWVAEAAVALREELLRRGYPTPRPGPSPCMIDRRDALTVDWDGRLYKCPGLVGRPELAVGDLWAGAGDYRESHGVEAWRTDPACRGCAYLPLCFGGCRFSRLERGGTLAGVDCLKAFLAATLEPMLRQDLAYRPAPT